MGKNNLQYKYALKTTHEQLTYSNVCSSFLRLNVQNVEGGTIGTVWVDLPLLANTAALRACSVFVLPFFTCFYCCYFFTMFVN